MGIELNSTLNQFVNWASQEGIGKNALVHAKTTQVAEERAAFGLDSFIQV